MNEADLHAIPPFDTIPVAECGAGEHLFHPDPREYQRVVYEAPTAPVVRDFLTDPSLVPKGATRDPAGNVRAVFWQLRKPHP